MHRTEIVISIDTLGIKPSFFLYFINFCKTLSTSKGRVVKMNTSKIKKSINDLGTI